MCIPLKPVFSRHEGDGVQITDEPTGNLDSKTSQDVMAFLKAGNQRFQQTMVMITHNPEIARMADRIIRIEDGRIKTGAAGREEAGTISGKGGQAHVSGEK